MNHDHMAENVPMQLERLSDTWQQVAEIVGSAYI